MPAWFLVAWCVLMTAAHLPAGLFISRLLRDLMYDPAPTCSMQGWIKLVWVLLALDAAFWMIGVIVTSLAWSKGL